jgi:hypothetical protein
VCAEAGTGHEQVQLLGCGANRDRDRRGPRKIGHQARETERTELCGADIQGEHRQEGTATNETWVPSNEIVSPTQNVVKSYSATTTCRVPLPHISQASASS